MYLVGYGDATFEAGCEALNDIYKLFTVKGPDTNKTPLDLIGNWKGTSVFSASNRYFVPQEVCKQESLVPFKPNIDPYKILYDSATRSKKPLISLEENKVRYYEKVDSGENTRQVNKTFVVKRRQNI